jgi:predicted acetyltransferase
MMAIWRDVSAGGFQMDTAQIFYDAYVKQGFDPDGEIVHYVGYVDEQPVTSASLLCAGGIPGLYNISTPLEYRGRGYGTTITHLCLKVAQDRGYQYACVMPSSMGRKIYRKLGFVVSLDVPEYRWVRGERSE